MNAIYATVGLERIDDKGRYLEPALKALKQYMEHSHSNIKYKITEPYIYKIEDKSIYRIDAVAV